MNFLAAVEEARRKQPTLPEALLLLPGWVATLPLIYVATPLAVGTVAGMSVRRPRPSGFVRLRLTDGRWVGGLFASQSYASGSTERPQDLLLEAAVEVGEGGSFTLDQEGRPVAVGSALRVMRDTIQHLEFFDREGSDGAEAGP